MEPGVPLAAQTRGGRVEVLHTGHAVLLDDDGVVEQGWGDPETETYWRSAAKPLQAAAVVATGAWDAFGLDAESLAVAAGSHSGEPEHRAAVQRILDACGCGSDALRCGIHEAWSDTGKAGNGPAGEGSSAGPVEPDALGNNCSGKHAAILAAIRHMDWPHEYLQRDHPVHKAVAKRVEQAVHDIPAWGIDGCGIPTWWGSIRALARSMQLLWEDEHGRRVLEAMGQHPLMVAGHGKFCTDLARATRGRIVGKYGALGVYVALDTRSGHALAVKTASGHEKATKSATASIMQEHGWLDKAWLSVLEPHIDVPVRNHVGTQVGTLRPLV